MNCFRAACDDHTNIKPDKFSCKSRMNLDAGERAEKLREGVSIFYNLSTKGRNRWNGKNTAKLPIETQLHIRNARTGAQHAAELEARLVSSGFVLTGG